MEHLLYISVKDFSNHQVKFDIWKRYAVFCENDLLNCFYRCKVSWKTLSWRLLSCCSKHVFVRFLLWLIQRSSTFHYGEGENTEARSCTHSGADKFWYHHTGLLTLPVEKKNWWFFDINMSICNWKSFNGHLFISINSFTVLKTLVIELLKLKNSLS